MSLGAITFKHPTAAGLRVFGTEKAALGAGEDPATLHAVAGVLVKWPGALGAPPDDATVATWQAELDAAVTGKAARRAAIKADAESDAFVDRLRDKTAAEWVAFATANINTPAEMKQAIIKLGLACQYLLQGGRDK